MTPNAPVELALRTMSIGIGATAVMDLWALVLRRIGIPSLDFALLGRWLGHLPAGRWKHASILNAQAIRGERALGWCAHYGIGIGFAALLVSIYGAEWVRSPTPGPALTIGIVTVAAPLFVLQPALGLGIASSRTRAPLQNALKSVATHTLFGLGLYLAARLGAGILPVDP